MMAEPPANPSGSGDDQPRRMNDSLQVSSHSNPVEIPVFTCIVHVSDQQGGVLARVANLPDLTCEAANEREALSQLVGRFKRTVMELAEDKTDIPWIEPPLAATVEERTRWIPVHL